MTLHALRVWSRHWGVVLPTPAGRNGHQAYDCTRCKTVPLCGTFLGKLAHWNPQAAPRGDTLWLDYVTVLINVRLNNLTAVLTASGVMSTHGRLKKTRQAIAPQPAVSLCCLIPLSHLPFYFCVSHATFSVFHCLPP